MTLGYHPISGATISDDGAEEALADSISVTDFLSLAGSTLSLALTADAVAVSDTFAIEAEFERVLADTETVTDQLVAEVSFERVASDAVAVTDELEVQTIFPEDAVVVTDQVAREAEFERAVTDTVGATDQLVAETDYVREASDSVAVTDELDVQSILIVDTIAVTDQVAREACFERTPGGISRPADIAGLQLWLDADDASTITSDVNGVSAWANKASGSPVSVTQGTNDDKPNVSAAAINGRDTILFDDANGEHLSGAAVVTAAPIEIFVVSRTDATKSDQHVLAINDNTGPADGWALRINAGSIGSEVARFTAKEFVTSAFAAVSGYTIDTAHLINAREVSSSSRAISLDNETPATNSTEVVPTSVSATLIGTNNVADAGPGQVFSGDIAEIAVFDRVLTADERAGIVSYFNDRWGLGIAGLPDSTTDGVVATDDATSEMSFERTASDTILVTDQVSLTFDASLADSIAVADSVAVELAFGRFASDAIVVTDQVSPTFEFSPSDAISVTDQVSPTFEVSPSDTISVTDQIAREHDAVRELADVVAVISEITLVELEFEKCIANVVVVTDQLVVETDYVREASDSVAVADQITATFEVSPADAVSVTDALAVELEFARIPSDAIAISDQVIAGVTIEVALSDSVVVTDQIAREHDAVRLPNDAVVVADQAQAALEIAITLSDAIVVADAIATALTLGGEGADSITVTDSLSVELTLGASASDAITVTDTLAIEMSFAVVLSDAVVVADQIAVGLVVDLALPDTITITDTLIVEMDFSRSPADAVVATDVAVGSSWTFLAEPADTIAVVDDAAIKFPHAGSTNLLAVPSGRRTFMKQGDTLPAFEAVLQSSGGVAVNLVNSSARFILRDAKTRVVEVDRTASITNPPNGQVVFGWLAGETDRVGIYDAEIEIVYDDGSVETFPSTGAHRVLIGQNAS